MRPYSLKSLAIMVTACTLSMLASGIDSRSHAAPVSSDSWFLEWPGGMNGFGAGLALDGMGNVYATGYCDQYETDFDPGPGIDMLPGGVYLSKFTDSGSCAWTRTWPGIGTDVAVDDGSVYVCGTYEGEVDFDTGEGVEMRTGGEGGDGYMFLSRFSPDGKFIWVRTWGNLFPETAARIVTDGSGNVYVSGIFVETTDFDPGESVEERECTGGYDVYLSKFDSNGEFQWVRTLGGTDFDTFGGIDSDSSGNVFVSGVVWGSAELDAGKQETSAIYEGDSPAMFLCRLSPQGDLDWVRIWPGAWSLRVSGLSVGDSDAINIAGALAGTFDFDPSESEAPVSTIEAMSEAFLLRLDTDGSLDWVRSFAASEFLFITSVDCDDRGNVFVAGDFKGFTDLDPGEGSSEIWTEGQGPLAFLVCLDRSGSFVGRNIWGDGEWNNAFGMAVASDGSAYVTGSIHYAVDEGDSPKEPDTIFLNKISLAGLGR